MKLVNGLMKAPEVAVTMQEFSKEMTKVYTVITILGILLYLRFLGKSIKYLLSFIR